MKVGCLTFHNSSNYGSVLQTYALQETVKSLGYKYEIIDYSTVEKYKYDSLLGRNRELSKKGYLLKLLSLPYNYIKKRRFINFSNSFLSVTDQRYKSINDLERISDSYDYYICGSDQVWNAAMVRFDPAYFLSFVKENNKKISYAASFGKTDLTNTDRTFYQYQLATFDKISVREQSGQQIVWECANKKAEVVLDPTLLFTPQQWHALAHSNKVPEEPYILTYCLSSNSEMQAFIRKLKSQTGLKVVAISRGIVPIITERAYIIPSPLEFVGLFANASYIVTNSFHGTAFSSNLNRNFYTFIVGTETSGTNSRIVDFLKILGLQDRLMTACPSMAIDLTPPDFQKANRVLAEKRIKSIEFLKQALFT